MVVVQMQWWQWYRCCDQGDGQGYGSFQGSKGDSLGDGLGYGSFQGSKGVGEGGLGQGYDNGGDLGYLGSKQQFEGFGQLRVKSVGLGYGG